MAVARKCGNVVWDIEADKSLGGATHVVPCMALQVSRPLSFMVTWTSGRAPLGGEDRKDPIDFHTISIKN